MARKRSNTSTRPLLPSSYGKIACTLMTSAPEARRHCWMTTVAWVIPLVPDLRPGNLQALPAAAIHRMEMRLGMTKVSWRNHSISYYCPYKISFSHICLWFLNIEGDLYRQIVLAIMMLMLLLYLRRETCLIPAKSTIFTVNQGDSVFPLTGICSPWQLFGFQKQ